MFARLAGVLFTCVVVVQVSLGAAQTPSAPAPTAGQAPPSLQLTAEQWEIAKADFSHRRTVMAQQKSYKSFAEYIRALYAVTIEGNQKDYTYNLAQAQRMSRASAEFAGKGDNDKAELYKHVAQLYVDAARLNQAMVGLFATPPPKDRVALHDQITASLKKVEADFAKSTNTTMHRSWITDEEYNAYVQKIAPMLRKMAQEPAAPPAPTPRSR